MKPKGHYILVQPDAVEEKSEGGIVLNIDEDREFAATTSGTVVAIGPTAWMAYDYDKPAWKPWAKVGEHISFVRHASTIVKDLETGDKYFVLADENVLVSTGREA